MITSTAADSDAHMYTRVEFVGFLIQYSEHYAWVASQVLDGGHTEKIMLHYPEKPARWY